MKRRARLWICLFSPFAGLLLAEGLVRAFDWTPAPRPRVEGSVLRLSLNPSLTFENNPGALRRTEYRWKRSGEPVVIEERVNARGFRGPEVLRFKLPGSYRIACVGDSHTFGVGVAVGEAWPAELERELRRSSPQVEVMNCGVSAYDTPREVVFLRERVLDYEPDLVLLQYHVNDVGVRNRLGWKAADAVGLRRRYDAERLGWLWRASSLSKLAAVCLDLAERSAAARDESGLALESYADDSPGWRAVRQSLREARDLLDARGTAFAVVLFPFLSRHGRYLSSHAAFQRVAEFCAAEGIACLDTEPLFLGRDIDLLRVHPHDYHAGAEAHRIFARAVGEWLPNARSARGAAPQHTDRERRHEPEH